MVFCNSICCLSCLFCYTRKTCYTIFISKNFITKFRSVFKFIVINTNKNNTII